MNRKSQIINAYLTLLARSPWDDISFSDVATSLSLTKTALFRYFPNKKALENAAEKSVYDDFLFLHQELALCDSYQDILVKGTTFLLGHKNLFPYYLQLVIKKQIKQSFSNPPYCLFSDAPKEVVFRMHLFLSATIGAIEQGKLKEEKDIQPFVDSLIALFADGLGAMPLVDKETYLATEDEVSCSRYALALNKLIATYGTQSFSITRYAQCLGVAPSTIYSTFTSKEGILHDIAEQAWTAFLTYLEKKIAPAASPSEALVAIAYATDSYLSHQPMAVAYMLGLIWMKYGKDAKKTYTLLGKTCDDLDGVFPGLGLLSIVMPVTRTIEGAAGHGQLSQEEMLLLLFHGCTRKETT